MFEVEPFPSISFPDSFTLAFWSCSERTTKKWEHLSHLTNLNTSVSVVSGDWGEVGGERLPGAGYEGGHMLTRRSTLGTEQRPSTSTLSLVRPSGARPCLVREETGGLGDMTGLQSAAVVGHCHLSCSNTLVTNTNTIIIDHTWVSPDQIDDCSSLAQ